MKALFAALFAVMMGLTFAASTCVAEKKKADAPTTAEGKKADAPAADKAAGDKMEKTGGFKKGQKPTETMGTEGKKTEQRPGGCPEGPPCK